MTKSVREAAWANKPEHWGRDIRLPKAPGGKLYCTWLQDRVDEHVNSDAIIEMRIELKNSGGAMTKPTNTQVYGIASERVCWRSREDIGQADQQLFRQTHSHVRLEARWRMSRLVNDQVFWRLNRPVLSWVLR